MRTILLFVAIAILTTGCPNKSGDTKVDLLFVVNVSSAKIAKVSDDKRELSFKVSDVISVVGFADRPKRLAFNTTAETLATMWDEGDNSFASDPPNAVIKDSMSRVGVTEVTGFSVSGDVVVVQLNRTAYKSMDAGDSLDGDVEGLTLFIDQSIAKVVETGTVGGLLFSAAKGCAAVDCYLWPLGG